MALQFQRISLVLWCSLIHILSSWWFLRSIINLGNHHCCELRTVVYAANVVIIHTTCLKLNIHHIHITVCCIAEHLVCNFSELQSCSILAIYLKSSRSFNSRVFPRGEYKLRNVRWGSNCSYMVCIVLEQLLKKSTSTVYTAWIISSSRNRCRHAQVLRIIAKTYDLIRTKFHWRRKL